MSKPIPKASLLGLDLIKDPVEFTKKAVQKHGHVWELTIGGFLGPKLIGFSGSEALKAFYDPKNIARYPAANFHVLTYAWTCRGYTGLPALEGPSFLRRKRNFMSLATRESAERFLQVTDANLVEVLKTVGTGGKAFSYWDVLNRHVFETYSKEWFGLGILEYEGGAQAAAIIQAIADTFAIVGAKEKPLDKWQQAQTLLTDYFEATLAAVRKDPAKYSHSRLAAFLKTEDTQKLTDEEIIMDFYQVLVFGTYGLVTQGVTLVDALIEHPEVFAAIKKEVQGLSEPLSLKSLLELDWTVAFVKECLRYYPIVHSVVGYSLREFTVDGMTIPAHQKVMACLWGTLNDPQVFEDPDKFDPARHMKPRSNKLEELWNDFNVAFGAGPGNTGHACGGKQVAVAGLVHQTVRLVQLWDFHKEDPDEQIVWPRCEPHPENGWMLVRGPEPERKQASRFGFGSRRATRPTATEAEPEPEQKQGGILQNLPNRASLPKFTRLL